MPMLSCFHNVDDTLLALANPCVTDEANPQLSARSKTLLKFHYHLGHIGFQHLRWLLKNFKLFGAKGYMAAEDATITPCCSSCVTGGMQRQPIAKGQNKHTQDHNKRGILKREQLTPGSRIFSDQYVSSLKGKAFQCKRTAKLEIGLQWWNHLL